MAKKTTTKAASRKSQTAKKASPKKKSATRSPRANSSQPVEEPVQIDRRNLEERRQSEPDGDSKPKLERREKVQRRRQIDPTTCERDYSGEEVEFMNALDDYKRSSGRMFPTCSEVLEVIRGLGYVRLSPSEIAERKQQPNTAESDEASDSSIADDPQLRPATESDESPSGGGYAILSTADSPVDPVSEARGEYDW